MPRDTCIRIDQFSRNHPSFDCWFFAAAVVQCFCYNKCIQNAQFQVTSTIKTMFELRQKINQFNLQERTKTCVKTERNPYWYVQQIDMFRAASCTIWYRTKFAINWIRLCVDACKKVEWKQNMSVCIIHERDG